MRSPKGYRGPTRLGICGALATALGAAVAVAAFVLIQVQGVAQSGATDIARSVLGIGSSGGADDASVTLIALFVAGFVVALLGLAVLTIAGVWWLVRYRPRERAARTWDQTRPVREAAKPKLTAAAERGQQGWETAKPQLSAAAGHGRRRLGEAVARRRGTAADGPTTGPTAAIAPPAPDGTAAGRAGLTSGDPLAAARDEPERAG
jgi:hypothetical protein